MQMSFGTIAQEETNINWYSSTKCLMILPHFISHLLCLLFLVQNASGYNLRNSNDTQNVASRTTLFYISFLPSSNRDWNRLNPDIRNAGTLDAFKHKLNQNLPVIPKHYYPEIRKHQIWHTRIRSGCSLLKMTYS